MDATKRPWAVHGTQIVREGEGFEYELASTSNSPISREEATANARLIVQAINNFDKIEGLVKAANWASQQSHHPACAVAKLQSNECECFIITLKQALVALKEEK